MNVARGFARVRRPEEPVKKPLTAETAETAEKKTLRFLGVLCVLSGKTPHFFTRSEGLRHYRLVVNRLFTCHLGAFGLRIR